MEIIWQYLWKAILETISGRKKIPETKSFYGFIKFDAYIIFDGSPPFCSLMQSVVVLNVLWWLVTEQLNDRLVACYAKSTGWMTLLPSRVHKAPQATPLHKLVKSCTVAHRFWQNTGKVLKWPFQKNNDPVEQDSKKYLVTPSSKCPFKQNFFRGCLAK